MDVVPSSSQLSTDLQAQFKLAALYVEDALAGRLENGKAQMSLAPVWVERCFQLQSSAAFEAVLLFTSLTHMQLAWFEPASSFDPKGEYKNWPAVPAEVVIVLLFMLDIALKATYMGPRRFLSKKWHRQYLSLTLLYTLDLILLAASAGRPMRCLRGLTLLLRERSLRNMTSAIFSASKMIGNTVLLMMLLLLTYSAVGARVFAPAYYEQSLKDDEHGVAGAFNSTLHALSSCFQLSTTENYPMIAWPAYARYGPAAVLYFITFWYIVTFIVLAIVTAVIVDKFWTVSKQQIKKETVKERQGLMRAFALLDANGSGYITIRVWEGFLQHLMPKASFTEARVRFAMLDSNGDARLDAADFLQIRSQLDIKLTSLSPSVAQGRLRAAVLCSSPAVAELLACIELFRTSEGYFKFLRLCDTACVVAQAILLCMVCPDQPASLLLQMCNASLILFLLSSAMILERLLLMRSSFILHWSNISDVIVTVVAVPVFVWIYRTESNGPSDTTSYEWGFVPQLLIAFRLFWLLPFSQRFLPLLLRLAPILISLSVIILWFLSSFAIIGMELFSSAVVTNNDLMPRLCRGESSYFADFSCALLTNIQVLVTNDWNSLLYAVRTSIRTSSSGEVEDLADLWPTIYFFLAYFLLQILLYPVLIALATNAYIQFSSNLEERNQAAPPAPMSKRGTKAEDMRSLVTARVSVASKQSGSTADQRFSIAHNKGNTTSFESTEARTPQVNPSSRRVVPIETHPSESSNPMNNCGDAEDDRLSPLKSRPAADARVSVGSVESRNSFETTPSEDGEGSCSRASSVGRRVNRRSYMERLSSRLKVTQEQNAGSCYYVQMRKSCHYRMGEWRRELMANDLASIDKKELEALSHEARRTQERLVALGTTKDRSSTWGRAFRRFLMTQQETWLDDDSKTGTRARAANGSPMSGRQSRASLRRSIARISGVFSRNKSPKRSRVGVDATTDGRQDVRSCRSSRGRGSSLEDVGEPENLSPLPRANKRCWAALSTTMNVQHAFKATTAFASPVDDEQDEVVRSAHRRLNAKGVVHFDDQRGWSAQSGMLEHGMLIYVNSSPSTSSLSLRRSSVKSSVSGRLASPSSDGTRPQASQMSWGKNCSQRSEPTISEEGSSDTGSKRRLCVSTDFDLSSRGEGSSRRDDYAGTDEPSKQPKSSPPSEGNQNRVSWIVPSNGCEPTISEEPCSENGSQKTLYRLGDSGAACSPAHREIAPGSKPQLTDPTRKSLQGTPKSLGPRKQLSWGSDPSSKTKTKSCAPVSVVSAEAPPPVEIENRREQE